MNDETTVHYAVLIRVEKDEKAVNKPSRGGMLYETYRSSSETSRDCPKKGTRLTEREYRQMYPLLDIRWKFDRAADLKTGKIYPI